MFDWHEDQQQFNALGVNKSLNSMVHVGDAIWAELGEHEDHTGPYPKAAEDSTLVNAEDQKNNNEDGGSVAGIAKRSTATQTELKGMEKQPANQTNAHFSATRLDMDSWPDLPSLNPTLDRNYNEDNIASTYMDFSAESTLQKVTGNTTVQLDGEPAVFGNDHEEKSNSFLDCDWGNIGDFDDFDRLFSSDAIFDNEMVANGSNFLSTSSDLMDNTVQSIPSSLVPLDKQPFSARGPSLIVINEISTKINKHENKLEKTAEKLKQTGPKYGEQDGGRNHLTCEYSGKQNQFMQQGDVQKRQGQARRKLDERNKSKISSNTSGFSQSETQNSQASLQAPLQSVQTHHYARFHNGKNTGHVQHAGQFMFPGCVYPTNPFPTISSVTSIQAQDHQAKPDANSYRTSIDSPKHLNSIEKSQDILSRPLTMTPQEKIEKLRRRQQMQALIAIQQQQQQFGHEGSGCDTTIPQTYSPRNKKLDSLGSSIVIDENANNLSLSELIPSSNKEVHKSSTISDDPFIEEKIYYQLQDALDKLDTRTRLCIRDSLVRLAHSAAERHISDDRSSTNKTNKDEASENDTSSIRKRSSGKEAETNTNPIDRIVAHLLFHRGCSEVATSTKGEIISSTPLILEPEKFPGEAHRTPSECQRIEQETVLQL